MEAREKSYSKPIFIMLIVAVLAMFKVYLANETYYTSRDIQKISSKISALKEEKNILELKIEKLKYKNTISDPLFAYKQPETIEASSKIENAKEQSQIDKAKKKNKVNKVNKVKKSSTKELFNNINTEDIY